MEKGTPTSNFALNLCNWESNFCLIYTLPHGMLSDLNFFPLAWCRSIWVCLIVKSLMYRVRLSPFVLLLLLCLRLKHDGSKYL